MYLQLCKPALPKICEEKKKHYQVHGIQKMGIILNIFVRFKKIVDIFPPPVIPNSLLHSKQSKMSLHYSIMSSVLSYIVLNQC